MAHFMKRLLRVVVMASLPSIAAASDLVTCIQHPRSGQESAQIAGLHHNLEAEQLFSIQASSGTAACSAQFADSQITLSYRFKNGGSLQVTSYPAIEVTEQIALLPLTMKADPLALLMDAERRVFAPDGCGIDWKHGIQENAENAKGGRETVYRGTACNCQARVRRDVHSSMLRLVLRSAC